MEILVVGLNHKTAPVEVRERLAFDGKRIIDALMLLKGSRIVKECIILSTCNRVEIYAGVSERDEGSEFIKGFISDFHKIPRETLETSLYVYHGMDAVRHIFRVSSSLDSMIVGEPQILGQVKDAFSLSLKNRATGIVLNRLMEKASSVAKRIRTETRVAESAVSISFAAVELAKKIFGELSRKSFMLIGAGEMAELASRHLINNGVREVYVANRTYERAEELAREFDGKPIRFDDLLIELHHVDIVICSTGAPHYILMKQDIQRIMKQRRHKPMFIIDISVPRNIDPEINDIDNVYLYDIDDLQGVIEINIQERNREAQKAEEIVKSEVEAFFKWKSSLSAVPTIVALRDRAEAIRRNELEKALRRLGPIGEEQIKTIDYLTKAIVNKLIHHPTVALKFEEGDREELIATVKKLYRLNNKEAEG
ncbi:MAG: glutamyl-tRNA reductase [Thermodesulfovibrionia bacterium]